jgi:hypothetical protein
MLHLRRPGKVLLVLGIVLTVAAATVASAAGAPGGTAARFGFPESFLGSLGAPALVASTVPTSGPAAGDQNPYGVAVVPRTTGALVRDDILVSNFNDANNVQGTGSTIMQVDPDTDSASVFAQINLASVPGCTGGVGLTTALAVFRQGWVVVGSLPVTNGGLGVTAPGCLIVLNSQGTPVETITGPTVNGNPLIDGPWDMAAVDQGHHAVLFVTNVLDGIGNATPTSPVAGGTVVRVNLELSADETPRVTAMQVIADGMSIRPDQAALVVGPTGVGVEGDTLFVADSVNSQILAIPGAFDRTIPTTGFVISAGGDLNDPLGMVIAPNGDIVTANGNDGNAVETTQFGTQIATATLDTNSGGGGNLFGIALAAHGRGLYFVDDFSTDNALFVAAAGGP